MTGYFPGVALKDSAKKNESTSTTRSSTSTVCTKTDESANRKGRLIMASRALKIDVNKALTNEPDVLAVPSGGVDESSIAARAYQLWQARGCPSGSDQEDWFAAERELRSQTAKGSRAA